MDKVYIGIPSYGTQPRSFWLPLAREAGNLYKQDIELVDIWAAESMMADVNRNYIVKKFLESGADWLKWIDADNVDKLFSIRRLLDTKKPLVTGIYVKRQEEAEPVIYQKNKDGEYYPLQDWTRGQIIKVESAGLGGALVHRSVFEEVSSNYRMLDIVPGGGVVTVHKDDVTGDINDDVIGEQDGKVLDGVLHTRLRLPKKEKPFPYFMLKDGRTEDLGFFEMTQRCGIDLWCDTGVEIGHIGEKIYGVMDWKEWQNGKTN